MDTAQDIIGELRRYDVGQRVGIIYLKEGGTRNSYSEGFKVNSGDNGLEVSDILVDSQNRKRRFSFFTLDEVVEVFPLPTGAK
jgi:hypothetical protein